NCRACAPLWFSGLTTPSPLCSWSAPRQVVSYRRASMTPNAHFGRRWTCRTRVRVRVTYAKSASPLKADMRELTPPHALWTFWRCPPAVARIADRAARPPAQTAVAAAPAQPAAHDRRQISVVANVRVEGGKRVDRHCDDFFVSASLVLHQQRAHRPAAHDRPRQYNIVSATRREETYEYKVEDHHCRSGRRLRTGSLDG